MGLISFRLHNPQWLGPRALATVHMHGLDGIPWASRVTVEENLVSIQRQTVESGRVVVAVPLERFGEIAVCTATLPERQQPYHLELELARGTVGRLKGQTSNWMEGGLKVDAALLAGIDRTTELLRDAIFLAEADGAGAAQLAVECVALAVEQMYYLSQVFAEQVIGMRVAHEHVLTTLLGVTLPSLDAVEQIPLLPPVEVAALPIWTAGSGRDDPVMAPLGLEGMVAALQGARLRTIVGPLLDLGAAKLPSWLASAESFENRRQLVRSAAREALARVEAPVRVVHAAAGLNGVGHPSLTYPQQLQLTLDILEVMENQRGDLLALVSFDQPWGERLAWSVGGAHPMLIADSLLRHGVRLAALGLEIHLDYWPHGSLVRDPFQWIDLVDRWSQFGLPLFLFVCMPTGFTAGNAGEPGQRPIFRDSLLPEQQSHYLRTVVGAMLARANIEAIVWRFWHDDNPRFPFSGLVNGNGQPKPALQWWGQIAQSVPQPSPLESLPQ